MTRGNPKMGRFCFLKIVLCFWVCFCFPISRSNEDDDVVGLMAFKQSSVDADPDGVLSDWSTSLSTCSWRGVTCSTSGRVTGLNLTNGRLAGQLDLSGLMSLPSLTHVYFSDNSFSGSLNISVPRASSFEILDLSANKISDATLLFESLSDFPNLSLLNFSSNKLSGEVISNLTAPLKFLDLSHNNLTGSLLSLNFGSCRNLTVLSLSHNAIQGTGLPVSLTNCQLLESLDIGHNFLRSKIPGVLLRKFKNLRRLSLASNQFFGEIPGELGQTCGTLEELDLSGNQLTGELPLTFLLCSSVVSLNLGNNQLYGDFLSTVVSSLPSLKYLYVPFNNISGNVPLSLSNCTQLRVLDLSSNEFLGTLPSGFCSSKSPSFSSALERLLLANNYLTGTVPSELGNCRNLKTIDFSFNNLAGPIPMEIWTLPNILDVIMWANNLTGDIPEGICIKGGNLQTLILNNNHISGTIPLSISSCTNLIWVTLSSNRLTGEIPAGIGNLVNLAILQLGNNSLSGAIPPELGKCRSLIWLDLNSNAFTGFLSEKLAKDAGLVTPGPVSGKQFAFIRNEGGTSCRGAGGLVEFEGIRAERLANLPMVHFCPSTRIYSGVTVYTFTSNGSMIYLDMSYNSLSGAIPENFGSMNFLQVLNLGHNNITGSIPFSFGGLKAIGVLDLSHNDLQGFIPGSLGGLSFLSDLDVSNNNLTGPIPSGGQLTTFPASRYENNSNLCGVPLPPCGSGNGHRPRSLDDQKKKQSVAAGVVIGIAVSLLCMFILMFALYRMKKYQQKEEKRDKYIDSLPTSGSSSWKLSSVPEPLSINVATFEKPLRKLTFAHLLEATNGFSVGSLIGSGGFGEVYKAQLKDGCVVAIKKLIHITGQGDREFMAEMETIGKIKHRNLVPLLGYCKIGEERLLVYEYMKWGSLEAVLHEKYYQSFRCTAKGDVYSYGVVLLELLSGKRPIDPSEFGDDNNLVGWAKQLQKGKRVRDILDPELLSHQCEAELYHYLKISFDCLDDKPFRRPTMIQVMTMFKELQADSGSDILDGLSVKNSVIEESQEKEAADHV
ncbi:hypothetical protein RJ639_008343 [Escallonia herrerae]|uniref:non-specific serine/threonine protein kinase n=1 Tax=Escallonia herrerae TaxID=1293975 RepID=A0AA89ASE8_9ASTE|nr:hypothetical protein RJ639_008343 [Escallonia herrerae]